MRIVAPPTTKNAPTPSDARVIQRSVGSPGTIRCYGAGPDGSAALPKGAGRRGFWIWPGRLASRQGGTRGGRAPVGRPGVRLRCEWGGSGATTGHLAGAKKIVTPYHSQYGTPPGGR